MPRRVTLAAVSAGRENSVGVHAMKVEDNVARTLQCIERLAPNRPDLICLTECFHCVGVPGRYDELSIPADHEIVQKLAAAAKKVGTHLVAPIMERRGELTFNTALWLNRKGEIAGRYDKIHPTESEIDMGVTAGRTAPTVWETDFGKVGAQICFDLNWPEGWSDLDEAGAELVVWPSAYAGGRPLAAQAFGNQRFILTATWPRRCRMFDISGDILVECGRLADFIVATIDLDRRLFHWDFQGDRLEKIRAKYGNDVQIDIYHEEGWFALNSNRDGLGVADLMKEFDLVPLDKYLERATAKQDEHRPAR